VNRINPNKYNITSLRVFTGLKEPIILGIARCKDCQLPCWLLIYLTRSFSLSKGAASFQSSDTNKSKVSGKVKKNNRCKKKESCILSSIMRICVLSCMSTLALGWSISPIRSTTKKQSQSWWNTQTGTCTEHWHRT